MAHRRPDKGLKILHAGDNESFDVCGYSTKINKQGGEGLNIMCILNDIINRPGVARAVLTSPP